MLWFVVLVLFNSEYLHAADKDQEPEDSEIIECILLKAVKAGISDDASLEHLQKCQKRVHAKQMAGAMDAETRQEYEKSSYVNFLEKKYRTIQQFPNSPPGIYSNNQENKKENLEQIIADLEKFKSIENFHRLSPHYRNSGQWAVDAPMEVLAAHLYEKMELMNQGKDCNQTLERNEKHAQLINAFKLIPSLGSGTKRAEA